MTGLLTLVLAVSPVHFPAELEKAEQELSQEVNVAELKAHVYRLASTEFAGRRGPGAARASKHLAELFQKMGLEPAFDGSYFQPIPNFLNDPMVTAKGFLGRNVAAVLPGTDLAAEWLVFSAHFDHLGVRAGQIYPGADDNASGVAALLEVAEHFALSREKPRRTILFVAFDLEEAGLLGSRYFASHPPRDLKQLKVFLTADMLGRSMANLMEDYLFTLGCESSQHLQQLVKAVAPEKGLQIGKLGTDIIGTRSDYGPFRDRKIPFLFFSTGQHPDYHKPTDLPDRVDYHRLQKISRWLCAVIARLANDDEAPVWNDNPQPDLAEVQTMRELLKRVLDHPKALPLTEQQLRVVGTVERRLAAILERGTISASERSWLIWTARILLVTVF